MCPATTGGPVSLCPAVVLLQSSAWRTARCPGASVTKTAAATVLQVGLITLASTASEGGGGFASMSLHALGSNHFSSEKTQT